MGILVDCILPPAKMGVGLAEQMLKDVTPAIFARKPVIGGKVIEANHGAFNFGHLALYPARLMTFCGLDATKAAPPAGFEDLFAAGKECKDDPAGTIYPKMEVITEAFFRGYRTAIEALPSVGESVFLQPNPREQMRGRLPTIGSMAVFMMTTHVMMHLGQVSTWRRCFGLGPVM